MQPRPLPLRPVRAWRHLAAVSVVLAVIGVCWLMAIASASVASPPPVVHAGAYVAGQEERTDPNGCFFKGLREVIIRSPFSLDYCAMRWKGWGASNTTGLGVARIGFQQYGLRVKLSRIRRCRQWAMSYTQETAEIWGAGETLTGQGNVSSGAAARLRALVGRAGQPHKTVRLTMPGGAGCVG